MRRSGALTIDFVGENHEVAPTRLFTFGRHGDLPLDTSLDLPSVVGVFAHENGIWWLRNRTSSVDIHLFDADTRSALLLNLEQRQLLTALAEGSLRGVDPHELPSNADVAVRLGWRITKLNRKLDHLCIKFDKLGVVGLRGSARRLATERRRLLVEHCLVTGLITKDDLRLLPPSD